MSSSEHLSTGFSVLDDAMGPGGLPRRRLSSLTGPTPLLNQALALRAAADAQRRGRVAAYVMGPREPERQAWAAQCAIRAELLVSQPACQEDALEIAGHLVRSGAVDLIILDDVDLLAARWRSIAMKRKFAELVMLARYSPASVLLLRSSKAPSGFSNALRYYSSLVCGVVAAGKSTALVKVLKDCHPHPMPHQQVQLSLAP